MAVRCLAMAVYYEAALEPRAGQEAVAQVVLNRVRHAGYPKSVCGVVFQGAERPGCQFSFACDGSTGRPRVARLWRGAMDVAENALSGHVQAEIGLATHYHADWVAPAWASSLIRVGHIGRHVFFRPYGPAGGAEAFRLTYAGSEQPGIGTDVAHARSSIWRRAWDGLHLTVLDLASLQTRTRQRDRPHDEPGARISDLPGAKVLFARR